MSRVKSMRENVKALVKEYNKTEDDLKALQVCNCLCCWSRVSVHFLMLCAVYVE